MATWIEILGITSTIIGLIVAIPTLYYIGRSVYRRFTRARQIPRLRQAAIQQILTLLNMKDDMIERYGFPEDLRQRWHSEQRHCEDLLQRVQAPLSNAVLSFIKALGWCVWNDPQLEALNARRDAVKALIDEWSENCSPAAPILNAEQGDEDEFILELGLGSPQVEDPVSYLPVDSAFGGLLGAVTRVSPREDNRAQAFLRYFAQIRSIPRLVYQSPLTGAYSQLPSNLIRRVQATRQSYLPLLVVSVNLVYLFSWVIT